MIDTGHLTFETKSCDNIVSCLDNRFKISRVYRTKHGFEMLAKQSPFFLVHPVCQCIHFHWLLQGQGKTSTEGASFGCFGLFANESVCRLPPRSFSGVLIVSVRMVAYFCLSPNQPAFMDCLHC